MPSLSSVSLPPAVVVLRRHGCQCVRSAFLMLTCPFLCCLVVHNGSPYVAAQRPPFPVLFYRRQLLSYAGMDTNVLDRLFLSWRALFCLIVFYPALSFQVLFPARSICLTLARLISSYRVLSRLVLFSVISCHLLDTCHAARMISCHFGISPMRCAILGTWCHITSYRLTYCRIVPSHISPHLISSHLACCRIVSSHIISAHLILSCPIWYPVISPHIVSSHPISSCPMRGTEYHIPGKILAYHLRHSASHNITSHDIHTIWN